MSLRQCLNKAATERHDDGDFSASIGINAERFNMTSQLARIFKNTQRGLDW